MQSYASSFPIVYVVSMRCFLGLLNIVSQTPKSSVTSGSLAFQQVKKHQHFVFLSPENICVQLG